MWCRATAACFVWAISSCIVTEMLFKTTILEKCKILELIKEAANHLSDFCLIVGTTIPHVCTLTSRAFWHWLCSTATTLRWFLVFSSFSILFFLQAESLDGAFCVPDIKLHSNPSAFNVYCNVRHCVLDWQQREASLALASRSSVQSGDSDSEEEEEFREPAVKLPKVGVERITKLSVRWLKFLHHSQCWSCTLRLLGWSQFAS